MLKLDLFLIIFTVARSLRAAVIAIENPFEGICDFSAISQIHL